MPKLSVLKPKQLIRVLEQVGFVFVRQKGSHQIFVRGTVGITVPMHNRDMKPGTLRQIIKQAELTVEDLQKFL